MTKDAAEQIWKSYLEAYSNVSPEERRRLLELAVSDDIVSSNPGDQSVGLENLMMHVEEFQQRLPGAYFKLISYSSTMNRLFRSGVCIEATARL